MRTMWDSTTAGDIPAAATMVAGYVDAHYAWSAADWAHWRDAGARLVRIAAWPSTNAGDVLDVETGNATPLEAPAWVTMRRAAGADPTVYCNTSTWPQLLAAFDRLGTARPHWWLAEYAASQARIAQLLALPGVVAVQYADEALTGGHYDLSAVADHWPGVDPEPEPSPPPHHHQEDDDVRILDHGDGTVWLLSGSLYVPIGPTGSADEDSLYASGVTTAAISGDLHNRLVAASTSAPKS